MQVKPGEEGRREFELEVKRLMGYADDAHLEFDVIFECRAPHTGEAITLPGFGAYDAATHCAAVQAGQRRQLRRQRQQQEEAQRQRQVELQRQHEALQEAQRLPSTQHPAEREPACSLPGGCTPAEHASSSDVAAAPAAAAASGAAAAAQPAQPEAVPWSQVSTAGMLPDGPPPCRSVSDTSLVSSLSVDVEVMMMMASSSQAPPAGGGPGGVLPAAPLSESRQHKGPVAGTAPRSAGAAARGAGTLAGGTGDEGAGSSRRSGVLRGARERTRWLGCLMGGSLPRE